MNQEFYEGLKDISYRIRYSNLQDMASYIDINASKDKVNQLDKECHNILIDKIKSHPDIIGYISEEGETITFIKEEEREGYVVSFDPLDGSSNTISNITIGSIFCLYSYKQKKLEDIVYAGYCLYGPSTLLVETVNQKEVKLYSLDKDNVFVYQRNLNFENKHKKLYAINESNSFDFDSDIKFLIRNYKTLGYNQRWVGSMVADCHQVLISGGVFIYPGTKKNPNGKIRLLYEGFPFSYIFKIAGGHGIDMNYNKLLNRITAIDIHSTDIHKPCPIVLLSDHEYNNLNSIMSHSRTIDP